jgi:eukaryotic-like serine/threonine-protein kinase
MTENVKKRFIREARVQQGFTHKNIVPVVGGDLDNDPPFYLMPVAISTLADEISKRRTLEGKFVSALSDVVAALEELHGLEIFHRDLKPQNVLRLRAGADTYYAVSDFGLISQKDSTLSKLTTTGMAKGSDYFTAPEITSDLRKASVQSDTFSLGCILHEMVGTRARVPCQEIRGDGDYAQILLSCTRNDAKRRFGSVRAVLDALVSIDTTAAVPTSELAIELNAILDNAEPLTEAQWSKLIEFIEDHEGAPDSKLLLMKLTLSRIQDVCSNHAALAMRLGVAYAEWVTSSAFPFDACDGIANRLEFFIKNCSLQVKVDCLIALLELGTSHNRWFVERKFLQLCGPEMGEPVARRLAIEFRASQQGVCRSISHLEQSIGVSRTELHPLLVETLGQICL